jgi:hypothetical protein
MVVDQTWLWWLRWSVLVMLEGSRQLVWRRKRIDGQLIPSCQGPQLPAMEDLGFSAHKRVKVAPALLSPPAGKGDERVENRDEVIGILNSCLTS